MPDIDDPFKPLDATVLRPRPGAGKRGSATDSGPLPFRPPAGVAAVEATPVVQELLAGGLNPLVQAASPLLLLAGQLRGTLSSPDLHGLRRYALDEVRRFEERAKSSGIPNETMLAARYALCAALDEAVLSTPWGAQSEWAQQPLLVALHREAWGGEKFFDMLDRISRDPGRFIDLMELQYLCIAFGFAGKYQVLDRGHARLAEVHHELYKQIRAHRGTVPAELALKWRGVEDRRNRLVRYVPWWVVAAAALAIMAVTFTVYYARLGRAAEPVAVELSGVGVEQFRGPAAPAPAPAGPTLKQLLADDERAGRLSVVEDGGRTLITLVASDLFASASARPNPDYEDMLGRIAAALNQVPGHVLIEGHTDDQPLRSLTFRNNVELSRERALGVARILERTIDNPARLEKNGRGSSQPLYPEPTPENRARNRRVEIIHVRG